MLFFGPTNPAYAVSNTRTAYQQQPYHKANVPLPQPVTIKENGHARKRKAGYSLHQDVELATQYPPTTVRMSTTCTE
jgi:hypothetical protein